MKKIVLAGLLICLCIALVACTATDPDNLFEIEPDNTVASTPESQEETTASVPKETQSDVVDIMYYTGAYQYGNMQKGNEYFLLFGNEREIVVCVTIRNQAIDNGTGIFPLGKVLLGGFAT